MNYFVLGEPADLCRTSYFKGRTWDSYKFLKEKWREELSEQHWPSKLIIKPIDLEIFFFFQQSSKLNRTAYPSRGEMSQLIKFVTDCGISTLFRCESLIVNINCHKVFTLSNPRTELIITETNGKKA